MRAYIHAFHGRPWNTECQAAYEGFQKLGIETVLFSTNEEFDTRHPEDVVVGGTVIVWHALKPKRYNSGALRLPARVDKVLRKKNQANEAEKHMG